MAVPLSQKDFGLEGKVVGTVMSVKSPLKHSSVTIDFNVRFHVMLSSYPSLLDVFSQTYKTYVRQRWYQLIISEF